MSLVGKIMNSVLDDDSDVIVEHSGEIPKRHLETWV